MNDEAQQFYAELSNLKFDKHRLHERENLLAKIPPSAFTTFTECVIISNAFKRFSRGDFENYLCDLGIEWTDLRYFEGRHYLFVTFDESHVDEIFMLIRSHPFEGAKMKPSLSFNPDRKSTRVTPQQ